MKKIKVLTENCIGCGACVGLDDEHFTFNEEGFSIVKSNENIDEEKINEIIEACPVGIISLVNENCENCHNECHCEDEIV